MRGEHRTFLIVDNTGTHTIGTVMYPRFVLRDVQLLKVFLYIGNFSLLYAS